MARINHFIVLMQENRSFDHLFGFFPPPVGQEIENILALEAPPVNLLDSTRPKSASNPAFEVSRPAPFVEAVQGPAPTTQGEAAAAIQARLRAAGLYVRTRLR